MLGLDQQVEIAERTLSGGDPAGSADVIAMVSRGLDSSTLATFPRAFTAATSGLPLQEPVIVRASVDALPQLAAA
ncbi:MAG: hypothetical protein ACRDTD_32730, partial [Pseudonocardiaceae bacterium]